MRVYEGPKARRRDIVDDPVLLSLMERHEERCNYRRLEECVMRIEREGERAVEDIIALLRFDYTLRPFVSKKLGMGLKDMDFVFGRPLVTTISMYGLDAVHQPDGAFFLTTADSALPGSAREE
jgi:hypothetical protein